MVRADAMATGPAGISGTAGEVSETTLFPEAGLDVTVSERCAAYIRERVSYEGTEREIADRQEADRMLLLLPTRFMSQSYSDEQNWRDIVTNYFGHPGSPASIPPACSDQAERWGAFSRARSGNAMWF